DVDPICRQAGPKRRMRGAHQLAAAGGAVRLCSDTRIGAVDLQMDQDLDQHASDRRAADLARLRLGAKEPMQRCDDRRELRREAAVQDIATAGLLLADEILRPIADRLPQPAQPSLSLAVMEHARYLIHEIVASGAVAAPIGGQSLAGPQDLLD